MSKNLELKKAFRSMGYKERESGKWLKPIGYQCFAFSEDKKEFRRFLK